MAVDHGVLLRRESRFARFFPYLFGCALGLQIEIRVGITVGAVVAVLMLPVWGWRALGKRQLRVVAFWAVGAVFCGLVMSGLSSDSHMIDWTTFCTLLAVFMGGLLTLGALVCCMQDAGVAGICAAFGAGSLVAVAFTPEAWSGNVWKYYLAIPITALLLGFLNDRRNLSYVVLVGLAVIDTTFSYRSHAAISIMSVLLFWVSRNYIVGRERTSRRVFVSLILICIGVLIYQLGTAAALSGRLGQSIQVNTLKQVERGGSVIEGGRPEWNGTLSLMRYDPFGFGPGVVPLSVDAGAVKQGLLDVNVGIGGDYVNQYMLGGHFKLHSVVADLWVNLGIVGLVLGLYFGLIILLSVAAAASQGDVGIIVIFFGLMSVWFLAFGPIWSNWIDVCFGVAIAISARQKLAQLESTQ